MRKLLVLYLFVQLSTVASAQLKTPAELYPGLFDAVQMSKIYPDGKTFPDASPRRKPQQILKDYNRQKDKPGFDLRAFVKQNFNAPATNSTPFHSNIKAGVRKHIDTLWSVLQHVADTVKGTSLLALPNSYIVPGGRFREIYYWDSYFTMLGLEESHRYATIENMIKNFAYLIDKYGHIPNGNRTYYLSRSQPPFFSLMVELLAQHKGQQALVDYQPELVAEYTFWMEGTSEVNPGSAFKHTVGMPDGSLLNRYWDDSDQPREESYREDVLAAKKSKQQANDFYRNVRAAAESGWDFSSRWFADGKSLTTIQTTNIVPVDLNCLLYHLETVIARAYELKGNKKMAETFMQKAGRRKTAILKYCWNNDAGCFQDYNWKQRQVSPQASIAMAFPLFFNIASANQAKQTAFVIKSRFLRPGGVSATLTKTGQQWDRPNGWAPLQYVAIAGLRNYHQDDLAKTIATRWVKLNVDNFNLLGKLTEKYDIETIHTRAGGGEYPNQDGFGWTNGVLLKLMDMYNLEKNVKPAKPAGKGHHRHH